MKRTAPTLLIALAAGPALAQPAPAPKALPDAFVTAVTACVHNVQGKLAFNPPSDALAAAGVVLADPASAAELAPFRDLNLQQRIFGAVPSTPGNIIVGVDPTQKLCRVVIVDAQAAQVGAIFTTPVLADQGQTMVSNDAATNTSVYRGSVMGSPPLTITTQYPAMMTPPPPGVGAAKYIYTLVGS